MLVTAVAPVTIVGSPMDSGRRADATRQLPEALNALLADLFALYVKAKNFHWHVSGPHFRDYHLLLDDHGDQLFGITDDIAERVRKIGGTTIHSIGEIGRLTGACLPVDGDDRVHSGSRIPLREAVPALQDLHHGLRLD